MSQTTAGHTVPLLILAVLLFNSPLTAWLAERALPWYAMFVPWALIILLIGLNQRRGP